MTYEELKWALGPDMLNMRLDDTEIKDLCLELDEDSTGVISFKNWIRHLAPLTMSDDKSYIAEVYAGVVRDLVAVLQLNGCACCGMQGRATEKAALKALIKADISELEDKYFGDVRKMEEGTKEAPYPFNTTGNLRATSLLASIQAQANKAREGGSHRPSTSASFSSTYNPIRDHVDTRSTLRKTVLLDPAEGDEIAEAQSPFGGAPSPVSPVRGGRASTAAFGATRSQRLLARAGSASFDSSTGPNNTFFSTLSATRSGVSAPVSVLAIRFVFMSSLL